MSRKILITGGNGQLGSYLYDSFNSSYNIINTALRESSNLYKLDVTNSQQVKSVLSQENPDIIINCASYNNVDKAEQNKIDAREVIIDGLHNIIKFSNKNSMIVHISSDYIFNGDKNIYFEFDKPNPINYYGRLKLESENILIGSNKKYAIVRPNVLFSSNIDNKSNFLAWVVNNLNNNQEINIVDDQISNPVSVELLGEVVESIMLLNLEGIFNVGTADPISRYDFALKIANRFDCDSKLINKVKTKDLKQMALRPKNTFLSYDRINKELGIDIYSVDYYLKKYKEVFFE